MDVRCEKCQTEYELDESRLKPGGVTVKCTNCGHMFKIRRRTPTTAQSAARAASPLGLGDDSQPTRAAEEGPTTVERQWVLRLENGATKTCRELATLQQWIVSHVVTRETLISRTGRTWKRLGDIAELAQYFDIADEARSARGERPTRPVKPSASTMLGVGAVGDGAEQGAATLPDDGARAHRPSTPAPAMAGKLSTKTPPMGSGVQTPPAARASSPAPRAGTGSYPIAPRPAKTHTGPAFAVPHTPSAPVVAQRTPTGPVAHVASAPVEVPEPSSEHVPVGLMETERAEPRAAAPTPPPLSKSPPIPEGRSTAMWVNDPIKGKPATDGQTGPSIGKLSAIPDGPAFAGRVRVQPSDERSFDNGRVGIVEDDDDVIPERRGSRAGLVILAIMLLVGVGAAAAVYVFVLQKDDVATVPVTTPDAALDVTVDAGSLVVTPVIDAPEAAVPVTSALDDARAELGQDVEARLRTALQTLPKEVPETQAIRANLGAGLAQSLIDRAGLVADKAEADKLRKESKTIALDAGTAAQRALKAAPDDAAANLAMAHVLRLQGKSAKDMQRYIDAAKAKGGEWARDVALASALVHVRDGKLDDAKKAFDAIDSGANKLESSNDVRARFHRALIALAQNRNNDAKAAVDQVLAAQPDHAGAKALAAKLETRVSSTDPLPPEEPGKGSAAKPTPTPVPTGTLDLSGPYDQLLARANKLAETSCAKAIELYAKALEQKPNGVEALAGQGYCHIDAKQFASAFSKFRSALAISPRYEPALWGIGEAYQRQGRREQALEAYKAYLEVYPNAAKAQKQIDLLGGGTPPALPTTTPPPSGSAPPPVPTPEPTGPVPQPQKEPAPADGSGS
ncbi:MAG TPA: zinc-ribbon domain-containing protein [Kofleriaceae bacterium]|nr:zinc-ribbon domain-containing protein [Kofleriaceae bacterium]